ncbi:Ubiquinone biosynthesis O-methyltransferase [Adhaeretor mobilis]|uniref:Ubiquinone biosynthesis O-methyltransferase n=1 Tax=Adhaeretor mobilis TaxID=1930276 RepID=A0A517N1U4_9BACT|nr:Ubiquinone biosynthesis O-methyltransferase [Adhaeretor mobilis]
MPSVVRNIVDPNIKKNAAAWDELARRQAKLAQPAKDEDFRNPLQTVDPLGWLGGDIQGKAVLCLAAGGGRQSALYAAAGARVTVVDLSGEMLTLDRAVASERGLEVRAVETSMERLDMFAPGEFDCVIQPVSTCYVPDVAPVLAAVARVLRPGGIYVSQHKSPVSLQAGLKAEGNAYDLLVPYYRDYQGKNQPLPSPTGPSRLREPGTVEYLHRWEQLLGGMCRAGFVIEDLIEPVHADAEAAVGTFGHRGQFIAPYFRVKARRRGFEMQRTRIELSK